ARLAGLDAALDAAEQVDLPGHVQAQVVALLADALLAGRRLLGLAELAAGAAGDHRQLVVADVVADGAGGAQAGEGHAQLAVLRQRLLYQLAQGRVVELPPPGRLEVGAVVVAGLQGLEARRFGIRRAVVRAYGAGTDSQGEQGGNQRLHACTSWAIWLALRASRLSTKARIRT